MYQEIRDGGTGSYELPLKIKTLYEPPGPDGCLDRRNQIDLEAEEQRKSKKQKQIPVNNPVQPPPVQVVEVPDKESLKQIRLGK